MLTVTEPDGRLSSRPMSPLELDKNGALWFFIRDLPAGSPGADDFAARFSPGNQVNLAFAQPDDAAYLSLSGKAFLVRDERRTEALWSPTAMLWFPGGKTDAALSLLRVDIQSADYWDANVSRMVALLPVA
jgi:general stress protein 26